MPTILCAESLPFIVCDAKNVSAIFTLAELPSTREVGKKLAVSKPEHAMDIHIDPKPGRELSKADSKLAFRDDS